MLVFPYKTKKALKESVGKPLRFQETSMFGSEYKPNVWLTGVGPGAYQRKWYANVMTDENHVIVKVK